MSDLDSALWKRITQIVLEENRSFSYCDFVPEFEVDGQSYSIAYGTFRNKISDMLEAGKIQVVCYSSQAFYTIKGQESTEEPMTGYRTGVLISPLHYQQRYRHLSNDPVYRIIQNLPLGQRSLHDIRLTFKVNGIWSILVPHHKPDPGNNGIRLPPWPCKIRDLDIMVTIQPTDTVSIVIGCSFCPVAVDTHGVVRLSEALAIIEERLSKLTEECKKTNDTFNPAIPDHMTWTVTMWHFGADALITYEGEKIYTSWEVGQHALITAYAKDWKDGKRRIRIEKQEYPKKSLADALEEKLNANSSVVCGGR
jgi:hypothetical protein